MPPDSQLRSDRSRLICFLVLFGALGFGLGHAWMVSRYLERVGQETFRPQPAGMEVRDITLGVAADGRVWLRLTEERITRGDWRLSHTNTDGGAGGRPVFWHSAWSWWLEGLGRLRASWTGESLIRAIEGASFWAQLPLWGLAVGGGAWVVARLFGGGAATLFVVSLAGHRGFYVACYPGYPDHHGLIAAAAMGSVLGWVAADFGGDSKREKSSRAGVIVSALCGAFGLAISAASLAPVLAALGLAGLTCRNAVLREQGQEAILRGANRWRTWGRVGAVASLVFYVLEVAPDRFAWRLEVNNPLYALAWWGGAELVAWWWERSITAEGRLRGRPLRLGLALAALSAPLLVALIGGGTVFTPADPFIAGVHRHITEFHSWWEMSGSARWLLLVSLVPLALVPWARGRVSGAARVSLLGVLVVAAVLLALAVWQHRWWSLAAAAQAPLAAIVGSAFLSRLRDWRASGTLALIVLSALPGPVLLIAEQRRVARAGDVQAADAMQLLYRDLGLGLAGASPGRRPVVLASPDVSVGVGYYGECRVLGTLYWENGDGLRAAADLLTSTDDAAAADALRRAGVTHIVMVEPGDFTAEYLDALTAERVAVPTLPATLGRRLLEGRQVPQWARALPYAVPPQFNRIGVRVALYAFEPELSRAESQHALGLARLVAGDESAGQAALREAARLGSGEAALVLAWRWATTQKLSPVEAAEAVKLAAGAVAALPEAPAHRRVLAACFAAARRWPEAQATALRALDLAQEIGDAQMVAELERDFALYQNQQSLLGSEAKQ